MKKQNNTKYRISKQFHWAMSHRLPFHEGLCRNIHGHTYKINVELEGYVQGNGMVLDYYDITKIVKPLMEKLDHCFLCDKDDEIMLNFLKQTDFKYIIFPGHTTAENIAYYIMNKLAEDFTKFDNLTKIKIRLRETDDVYADVEMEIR